MPRRRPEPPSAMDQLDPAPREQREPAPAVPPRPPPREQGDIENAVIFSLRALPDDLRLGGIAVAALGVARRMDEAQARGTADRDYAALDTQLRASLAMLREWAPGAQEGDRTDELSQAREKRLAGGGP